MQINTELSKQNFKKIIESVSPPKTMPIDQSLLKLTKQAVAEPAPVEKIKQAYSR